MATCGRSEGIKVNIEVLRDALQNRPFKPFRVQLGDGTDVNVTHPESVAFHPKSPRTAVIMLPDGGFKHIDLMLVTAIHFGNGRRKKGRGNGKAG